jgi:C-terminal processing protease CtpA/Prc
VAATTVTSTDRRLDASPTAARGAWAIATIILTTTLTGFAAAFGAISEDPPGGSVAPTAAPKRRDAPRAWQRIDQYEPPDFERFFPDDPEAGKILDQLVRNYQKDPRSDEDKLQIVRQGLRRAKTNRSTILSLVSTHIWGESPQHPDAIEIMYHAADSRADGRDGNRTLLRAIHNGLSVVQPKSPAILRTFADLCMTRDEPQCVARIVWGTANQRADLIGYLNPYFASPDKPTRQRALAMRKILSGQLDAYQWFTEEARKRARKLFADRLPEVKQTLQAGGAQERLDTLEFIVRERLDLIMDDSFIAAFGACAGDKDVRVRREVAQVLGEYWIWRRDEQPAAAIKVMLQLARDADGNVRRDAVYYGLATVLPQSEEVVRAMVDCALRDAMLVSRVTWRLDRELARKVLDEITGGDDLIRAKAALAVYHELTTPEADGFPVRANAAEQAGDAAITQTFVATFRELHAHLRRAYPNFVRKRIDWDTVLKEFEPRVAKAKTEPEFGLLVEELVARLEDSHAIVIPGTATPPVPPLPPWNPGLACLIGDAGLPVVYFVEKGSSAEKAKVAVGQTIKSVNGLPADAALRQWMERTRRYYGYSSERTLKYDAARGFLDQAKRLDVVKLTLSDPDGRETVVELVADRRPRYIPRLPVPRPGIADSTNVSWTMLEGRIGYIYVRRIQAGLESALDRALRELGDMKGLIIDVRGNSGGGFDTSTAFVNFDPAVKEQAAPDRPRYKGPIALLIDERCISAGEGWASWFLATKRARFFGTTTAGASCRKQTYTLTNGLYRVVVPVKAYTGFLDRPIERRGLEPDVEVRCTARDLAAGRDTVVEAAAAWLARAGGG